MMKKRICGIQKQFDCYVKRTLTFIARNLLRREMRKKKAEPDTVYINDLVYEPSHCDIPYNEARHTLKVGERERCDKKESLKTALDGLTDKERQVIVLLYYKGLNPDEIADELSMTRNAVYMCKSRSVEKLRDYFRRNGDGT